MPIQHMTSNTNPVQNGNVRIIRSMYGVMRGILKPRRKIDPIYTNRMADSNHNQLPKSAAHGHGIELEYPHELTTSRVIGTEVTRFETKVAWHAGIVCYGILEMPLQNC